MGKAADEKDVAFNKCYAEVTQWNVVPLWPKIMLQASLLCVIASTYLCFLFASKCFATHTFTDTIEENLGGKWHSIVKPLGWVTIGLFVAATAFFEFFTFWGSVRHFSVVRTTVIFEKFISDFCFVFPFIFHDQKKAAEVLSGEIVSPTVLEIKEDDAHSPLLP